MANRDISASILSERELDLWIPSEDFYVPEINISLQPVNSFRDLFQLKALTKKIRSPIVNNIFAARVINLRSIESLKNARRCLEVVYYKDHETNMIQLDNRHSIQVDLSYEIRELKKDTYYLEHGEDYLIDYLSKLYDKFHQHVTKGLEFLDNLHFNCFITDRDGTTNNYCGHYRSSIQPVYNAVFLSRFATRSTTHPIFITSAPLRNFGIVDVSVNPDNIFIYAGSKGREFLDFDLREYKATLDPAKQAKLEQLHLRISELERQPELEKFFYVGSGLQLKFGQLTIARQDVACSISEEESLEFMRIIREIVQELDPEGAVFTICDTGRDIEIIVTVDGKNGLKDFDKGDGLNYIDSILNLDLGNGPHLVCGDTASDIPMLKAVMEHCDDVYAIFVTKDAELAGTVMRICPNTLIVPSPDILLTILGVSTLKKKHKKGRKAPGVFL